MNRKKKINKVFSQKAKKDNRKNQPSNKPRYISKADRALTENNDYVVITEDSKV